MAYDAQCKTNHDLAQAYRHVTSQVYRAADCVRGARKRAEIIEHLEFDIPKYYTTQGTVRNLTIRGIGPETLRVLDDILERGEEATIAAEVNRLARQDIENRIS